MITGAGRATNSGNLAGRGALLLIMPALLTILLVWAVPAYAHHAPATTGFAAQTGPPPNDDPSRQLPRYIPWNQPRIRGHMARTDTGSTDPAAVGNVPAVLVTLSTNLNPNEIPPGLQPPEGAPTFLQAYLLENTHQAQPIYDPELVDTVPDSDDPGRWNYAVTAVKGLAERRTWTLEVRQVTFSNSTNNLVPGSGRANWHSFWVDRTNPVVALTASPTEPSGGHAPGTPVQMTLTATDPSLLDTDNRDADGRPKPRADVSCTSQVGTGASQPVGPIQFTDTSSGTSSPASSGNGSDQRTGLFTVSGNAGDSVQVACTVTDFAGNASTVTRTLNFAGQATTPPSIAFSTVPAAPDGGSEWFRTAPTVKVDVTDPDSATVTLECLDGTQQLALVNASPDGKHGEFTIASQGPHTVVCSASDGGAPVSQTKQVKLDSIAPQSVGTLDQGTGAFTVGQTSDQQPGSGYAKTRYTLGTSPGDPRSDPAAQDYTGPVTVADGETIRWSGVDNAGNEEVPKSLTRGAPPPAPEVALTVSPAAPEGSNAYYRTPPTVHIAVGPAAASVQSLACTNDGANVPIEDLTGDNKAGKITLSAEGDYDVSCTASNASGSDTEQRAVGFDRTPPVTTDNIPASATGDSIAVQLGRSDNVSGVEKTYYTTDGSDPLDGANAGREEYTTGETVELRDGETITYASIDRAGNAEAETSKTVHLTPAPAGGGGSGGGAAGGASQTGSAQAPATGTSSQGASPSGTQLVASLAVARQRLAVVLRRGLAVVVRAGQPSRVVARLAVDRRTAMRLRLGSRVLGSRQASVPAGQRTVSVQLSRRARRALQRVRVVRVTLELTVTDGAGRSKKIARLLTLRR